MRGISDFGPACRQAGFGISKFLFLVSLLPSPFSPSLHAASDFPSGEALVRGYLWDQLTKLKPPSRPKIALVLGGGGARGMAHIGVLKVFEEKGIPVDMIVGASVGAFVGGLYAAGVPVERLTHLAEEIGWGKLTNLSAPNIAELLIVQKLLSTEKMERYIEKQIGKKTFGDLAVPFACVATDIQTGERILFREGDVATAVRASATIPGLFTPVSFRHRSLVDGGIADNLPVDVARLLGADIVIAVSLKANFSSYDTSNMLLVLNQVIYIQGDRLAEQQESAADFVLRPDVAEVNSMDLGKSRFCIQEGERAARRAIGRVQDILIEKCIPSLLKAEGRGN